jgi:hypothetical protein
MQKLSSKRRLRGDYKIGKGRPPRATQFKRGQSGNPRGRPKGRKDTLSLLQEALNKRILINENGKSYKITVLAAITRRVVLAALNGDLKSIAFIFSKEPEMIQAMREIKMIHPGMTAQEAADAYAETLKLAPTSLIPL